MTNLRIALSGRMASGKSLVAKYLVKQYGFKELAFAARLKEMAAELFNVDVKHKDEAGRLLLQQLAHHMRAIDPMIWVRYIIRRIPIEGAVVVSDVRYPNEFHTLQSLGFTMVCMYMSPFTRQEIIGHVYPGIPAILQDDYSERALDDFKFDVTINNDKGVPLDQVYRQVDELIAKLQEDS